MTHLSEFTRLLDEFHDEAADLQHGGANIVCEPLRDLAVGPALGNVLRTLREMIESTTDMGPIREHGDHRSRLVQEASKIIHFLVLVFYGVYILWFGMVPCFYSKRNYSSLKTKTFQGYP